MNNKQLEKLCKGNLAENCVETIGLYASAAYCLNQKLKDGYIITYLADDGNTRLAGHFSTDAYISGETSLYAHSRGGAYRVDKIISVVKDSNLADETVWAANIDCGCTSYMCNLRLFSSRERAVEWVEAVIQTIDKKWKHKTSKKESWERWIGTAPGEVDDVAYVMPIRVDEGDEPVGLYVAGKRK